jgi:hypothetical protein
MGTLKTGAAEVMLSSVKLIARTVVVVAMILIFVNIVSVAGLKILDTLMGNRESRAQLPNYVGTDWSRDHFREIKSIKSSYYSFYVWRQERFEGRTLNVDDEGLRRSLQQENGFDGRLGAFFGGSSMYGIGARDAETIPSFFAGLSEGYHVRNYGTPGFVVRQSLNRFLEMYHQGERPDIVITYDGFNEVATRCRSDLGVDSHGQERLLRVRLGSDFHDPSAFTSLLMPVYGLVDKVTQILRFKQGITFDCDRHKSKIDRIARSLLGDWLIMKEMTERHGGLFIAVLQPAAYLSDTKLDHLNLSPQLGEQLVLVYATIREFLKQEEFATIAASVYDFTDVLDVDEYIYVDEAHVSPNGNRYVAERMMSIVDNLSPSRFKQN